tara:strand:- start:96 stop:569 length:474 start_codon:yes stop_codon:yes gene_type:complete
MAAALIGKMMWKAGKWIAKRRLQSPSKLSKSVTKHSKAQRVRAQIADPKRKFPSAKKIKESGIKLKYLDPKPSQKGFTRIKNKPPTKKGLDSDYKALIAYGVGSTAASIGGGIYGQRRKKRHLEASKPYRQKKPVRGIQLGAPGTQSGTSRSKRRYK